MQARAKVRYNQTVLHFGLSPDVRFRDYVS